MDPLFQIPEDFAALTDEELVAFITSAEETIAAVRENTDDYVGEGRTTDELVEEFRAGRDALRAAKAEQESRATAAAETPDDTDTPDGDTPDGEESASARIEALASETDAPDDTPDGDTPDGEEGDAVAAPAPPVTAAAPAPAPVAVMAPPEAPLARPSRARTAEPVATTPAPDPVPLTASAGGLGVEIGQEIDRLELAKLTVKARERFGRIPPGTKGEKVALAQYDFRSEYPEERHLAQGEVVAPFVDKVAAVTDPDLIKENFRNRRDAALRASRDGDIESVLAPILASGGLCAPVTPYYNLQMVSSAVRPVRAALPAFNADRGGINAALPLSLASITTGVGTKTVAQDSLGGTSAEKTCQVIDCPPFVITDVEIIYHCIQFGNLGARTFPERVAQSNDLVLAAHARTAESLLLTNIGAASNAALGTTIGLGIVSDLLGQLATAAAGMRSRHRMDPEAVLRVMFPRWILDAMVSDTIRTQFGRFDMTADDFIRLIREMNVEPSFYIDGAAGAAQVYGAQTPYGGGLLPFPTHVVWYLYPEGSFLYLDGGILELGIVRDSVLNSTNDFQIFGESFENVAFVGVESLQITSDVCDSGAVSLPKSVTCPIDY